MGARNPLQRLLDLRRGIERQEEMKLALSATQLHEAGQDLNNARLARLNLSRLGRGDQATGAELDAGGAQHAVARSREQHCETRVADARSAHHEQRLALLERTRQRKILEALNDKREQTRVLVQGRRDQASVDENFLIRRQYALPAQASPASGDGHSDSSGHSDAEVRRPGENGGAKP